MLKKLYDIKVGWQQIHAFFLLGIVAFFMLQRIVPDRCSDLYNAYLPISVGLLAGLYFSRKGLSGPIELKIYFCLFAWFLLSRWLNRDVYLFMDGKQTLNMLISFLFLSAPLCLGKKERDILIDGLTIVYGGCYLLTSMVSVVMLVLGSYVSIPPEGTMIIAENPDGFLCISLTHRLEDAANLFMAQFLFVYQFFKRRNKLARFGFLICIVILHVSIALCHSRTTQIAMSGAAAMLTMIVMMPRVKYLRPALRSVLICATAAAALLCCYLSFDLSNSLVTKAHNIFSARFEAYYNSLETKPNEEYFGLRVDYEARQKSEEETETSELTQQAGTDSSAADTVNTAEISAVDNRKLAGNWTFTGRTEIWHAGIVSLSRDPINIIKGQITGRHMIALNPILKELYPHVNEFKYHMHNSFLETLMIAGLPGFCLALAWTILMVHKMLKLFFSKKGEHSLVLKLPILAISGMFVISMLEIFLFMWLNDSTIVFLFVSGIFLADYYECFTKSKMV